jgi:hypothetical protein
MLHPEQNKEIKKLSPVKVRKIREIQTKEKDIVKVRTPNLSFYDRVCGKAYESWGGVGWCCLRLKVEL